MTYILILGSLDHTVQGICLKLISCQNIVQLELSDRLFLSSAEYSCKLYKPIFCIQANSVDPDQTAPRGAV